MFIALRTQLIASLCQERNVAPLGLDALKVILSYKHSVPNGTQEVLLRSGTAPAHGSLRDPVR